MAYFVSAKQNFAPLDTKKKYICKQVIIDISIIVAQNVRENIKKTGILIVSHVRAKIFFFVKVAYIVIVLIIVILIICT